MLSHPLGVVLLSQDPAVQVPLALEDLTVVFGMGTCGTPPPSTPNGYKGIQKTSVDRDGSQDADSASNLDPALELRCSCRWPYTPLLVLRSISTFSALNSLFLNSDLKQKEPLFFQN